MRKMLFMGAMALATGTYAQVPVNEAVPVVMKLTATWCGPCGSWGWDLMEEIRQDNQAKAYVFACYGGGSEMETVEANAFYDVWGDGWPTFGVNNKNETQYSDQGGIYTGQTRTRVKAHVDSFVMTSPVASPGYNFTITGNTINVTTKTKFWQNTNGEYYINAYVTEDGVMEEQNGQSGIVAHHNVLRGGMSSNVYGEMVATGAVMANQSYNKDFTFNIPAGYDKTKLHVFVVVWKKSGSGYTYINASYKKTVATSVANVAAASDLRVYPNPAADNIQVSGTLNANGNANISLMNAIGQTVFSKQLGNNDKKIAEQIDLSSFSNGVYMLNVNNGDAVSTQKVIINR